MSQKVHVSLQATIQRINRKLRKDGKTLKKNRSSFDGNLGDYFVVDLTRNFVVDRDVDVEELARDNGVLKPYERIEV
jgi:hypothetical protein